MHTHLLANLQQNAQQLYCWSRELTFLHNFGDFVLKEWDTGVMSANGSFK